MPQLWLERVAKTDGGMRVTDVWETREQFEQFAAEQIGPPPKTTFFEVHNYLTAG